LVLHGLRNGFVLSIINLIALPIGWWVAVTYGPRFTGVLAANGLATTPLIAYAVLFIGIVLIVHLIATSISNVVRKVPIVNLGNALLGGVVGLVEAWVLWLILLIILGNFLHAAQDTLQAGSQAIPGLNLHIDQLQSWHDFYNQAINNSLFARVNSFFVKQLPSINVPHPPQ
ncbi:MAG TPA: CvpA family protein, partial [Ktedonobacteraceae bacterium]